MALARNAVVDEVWELLCAYGLADLTRRRLAREPSAQRGALYGHIADKQTLLLSLAERMLRPVSGENSPAELVCAFRRAILEVRDGVDAVAVAHAMDPEALPPTVELAALLRFLGLNDEGARRGALALVRLNLGWVAVEQSRTTITGSSSDRDAMEEHDVGATRNVILRVLSAG